MNKNKFKVRDPGTKSFIMDCFTIDEALRNKIAFLPQDVIYLQYTGLKDRKGRELFEGDILQNGEGIRGIIMYGIHRIPLEEYDGQETIGFYVDTGGYNNSLCHLWNDWDYIGNIYENNKLL